jgi:guanylate cyclase
LFLPFLLTLLLGGFAASSAIILSAVMSPIGTLLYYPQARSDRWFAAYIVLLILAALLDPLIRRSNALPPWLIVLFFMLNVAALSSIVYLMIRAYIQQRDQATELLRLEQQKTDRLLLNVLPASIAAILKEEKRTIAERYETVSILFADVVGSMPLTEELDPAEVVALLNEVFKYFDTLVTQYGLEKIRTMGDNYMIASGVPTPRDDHAHALAAAALEMRHFRQYLDSPHAHRLQFRIGMNCGPVVAGVIGHTKFHYDIWGDPVNVASRMESQGQPGKIQISRNMYELLQDEFVCEPRGTIEVKGKGSMETWFLIDRRQPAA